VLTSGWPIMKAPESFARRHQHHATIPKQDGEPQHPIHTAATAYHLDGASETAP
jgi:hypothetical protein